MTISEQPKEEQSTAEKRQDISKVVIDLSSSSRDSWSVKGVIPAESLVELGAESEIVTPALVDIAVTRQQKLWQVQGDLEISATLPCSRCLNKYTLTLMVTVDRFFSTGQDPAKDFGQTEMEEDIVFLDTGEFSPLRFAEDEFILVLPMIPLCSDRCLGLCQNCGADKNREPCNCPDEKKENPFAILGNIKLA
jgi:uncharacterized protein